MIKHFGLITNGKRNYYNPKLHNLMLEELEGKEFEETIKLKHKKVSLDAYGYYYGGVIGTALKYKLFDGWRKDDVDDFFSDMFLSYHTTRLLQRDEGPHEAITILKVRSKGQGFPSEDMREFTDKVIMWLAENGIVVPTSEEYYSEQ